MSDSNIKDLYEERGRRLKEKEKKATLNAEKQQREYYQHSQNEGSFFQSPEMRTKYLQLQTQGYIDSNKVEPVIHKKPKWLGKKDYYQHLATDFLSFCLNWTRLEGKPLILTDNLIKEFKTISPQWKDSQYIDFSQVLDVINEAGLCTGNSADGYWFELQNDTKDLQVVFTLIDTKGRIYKSKIKEKLNWPDEKIDYVINLLEKQQIIIPDNDNKDVYWFLNKV